MAKRPNLEKIVSKMEKGKDFTLSRSQYLKLTGAEPPKDKWYTEKRSLVARCAEKFGYSLVVVPEKLVFEKRKTL